jgi:precorrin-2 dehydrogenase / sirohydrochlorin ferrochelatase
MPVEAPLYPVNLIVADRPVLVVGAGRVAAQKVRGLVAAGAVVTVVAPDVDDAVRRQAVTVAQRPYRRGEVADYRLAVAATGDAEVNQQVFDDGEAAGVWVNSADDPDRCSVTLPARLDRGRLLVTVSTGGYSPAVASWVRDQIAVQLGPEYDTLVGMLSEARSEVIRAGGSTEGLDWRAALDSGILDLIRADRLEAAKERLGACLSSSSD